MAHVFPFGILNIIFDCLISFRAKTKTKQKSILSQSQSWAKDIADPMPKLIQI